MTIAGRYELENTLGSQKSLTKPHFAFDKHYIRKLVFYTCLSNLMSRRFQKNYTWETPNDRL